MPSAAEVWGKLEDLFQGTGGNQLAEFAISLPLLMVIVVGIFDFGSAFTLKEKLVGFGQTGARVGASQPMNDLTSTANACPALTSVCAVRDVVSQGFLDSNLNDCGLAAAPPVAGGTAYTWTFTANTNCPGNLVLTVERADIYTVTLAAPFDTNPYQIVATRVTLSYPYQWQFNKVISLLDGNFTGPAQLKTVSVMQNLN